MRCVVVLLAALLAAGCSTPDAPAERAPAAGVTGLDLPNVLLTTHEGLQVRFYDDLVRGKAVAVNFMFATCRAACPAATEHLVEVQHALGDRVGRDVSMLSISLDPERDTPEVLKGYAEAHGVGPGWLFLTGRLEDVESLRRRLGLFDPDPVVDADRTQHAGVVVIGNEPLGRWTMISALVKPVRIVQTIEHVLASPSEWVVGPALDDGIPLEVSATSAALVERVDGATATARP